MPQAPKGPWGSFHLHLSPFQVTKNIFYGRIPSITVLQKECVGHFFRSGKPYLVRHFKVASDLPQNGKNVGMLVFE